MPINQQGGDSSGVGTPVGLGFLIADLSKKPKTFKSPFDTAQQALRNREMIATTERKIAEAVRLGNPVNDADAKRLAKLNERRKFLERKFESQARNPGRFAKAGIAVGTTLAQLVDFLSTTRSGQQIIAAFTSPVFNPAPLPSIGGTSTMPFVVTPAATAPGPFGGFGDFINTALRTAGQIFGPPPQRGLEQRGGFQQAGFPLVPFAGAAARKILPAIGLGAVGGEAFDALQNFFTGGAATQDDAAAFTDPIPGSCRPKTHLKVNPCTGKATWFTPRGRPLVFSGDMAACRRVNRVAKRLNKAMPAKHHHHRTARKK